jgi:hypothetical protein
MNISTSTLAAALLLSGVSSFAAANNTDVVTELANRPVVVINAPQLTRAEVTAQFLAARAAGELVAGENGELARELDPRLYPAYHDSNAAPKKSRQQVREDFLSARASGELIIGENGETARELNPQLFGAASTQAQSVDTAPAHTVRQARVTDKSYYGI